MAGKWASNELVELCADRLRDMQDMGMGRRRIARSIEETSERECTEGVVGIALAKLGLHAPRKGIARVTIVDEEPIDNIEMPIDELIDTRVKAAERKYAKTRLHRRTLEFPAEPFGIVVHGDPHLDSEGADLSLVKKNVLLVQQTEGMFGACVGDELDLWVGRLAVNYADASILASDGWRLSEWFLKAHNTDDEKKFLALVSGNHDAWANSPGLDPLANLAKKHVHIYAPDELRITFVFKDRPDIEPIIWIMRHDFKGRSYFHSTHGPHREAIFDGKAHLLTAGHIHQWGELTTEQRHGRVTSAVRVRGYKRCDDYAMSKGFPEQEYGCAACIIINPLVEGPGRIMVFWDIEHGCEFLSMMRARG